MDCFIRYIRFSNFLEMYIYVKKPPTLTFKTKENLYMHNLTSVEVLLRLDVKKLCKYISTTALPYLLPWLPYLLPWLANGLPWLIRCPLWLICYA